MSRMPLVFKLRAYIYQCRNLTSKDADGMSDPVVQIWDSNDTH